MGFSYLLSWSVVQLTKPHHNFVVFREIESVLRVAFISGRGLGQSSLRPMWRHIHCLKGHRQWSVLCVSKTRCEDLPLSPCLQSGVFRPECYFTGSHTGWWFLRYRWWFLFSCAVCLTFGEVIVILHFPMSLIIFVVFLGEFLEQFFLNK